MNASSTPAKKENGHEAYLWLSTRPTCPPLRVEWLGGSVYADIATLRRNGKQMVILKGRLYHLVNSPFGCKKRVM